MLYLVLFLLAAMTLAVILWPLRHASLGKRQRGLFAAIVTVLFMGGAFILYAQLGTPQMVPLIKARHEKLAVLSRTIAERSAQVKQAPANLAAWVELGENLAEAERFASAADAFRHAVVLSGGNPLLILAYAKAMIFAADGKVTDDAKKALEMVILQQPDNNEARYWLIVRQLQDGNTQQAMAAMKKLYHTLPADSPVKAMIDKEIGRK